MTEERKRELRQLCERLGLKMLDLELLNTALTHTSYAFEAKENPHPQHNQRLEFLGDSVLSIVVSTYIYDKYVHEDEGYLSKLRAFLVCEQTLATLARRYGVGDYLLLGHGELNLAGRQRTSTLADTMEAIFGAYYLEQGLTAVEELLYRILLKDVEDLARQGLKLDYKTRLQEKAQVHGVATIRYQLVAAEGPAHDRSFTMKVYVDEQEMGMGIGKSKKEAEQRAAREALKGLCASRGLRVAENEGCGVWRNEG